MTREVGDSPPSLAQLQTFGERRRRARHTRDTYLHRHLPSRRRKVYVVGETWVKLGATRLPPRTSSCLSKKVRVSYVRTYVRIVWVVTSIRLSVFRQPRNIGTEPYKESFTLLPLYLHLNMSLDSLFYRAKPGKKEDHSQ